MTMNIFATSSENGTDLAPDMSDLGSLVSLQQEAPMVAQPNPPQVVQPNPPQVVQPNPPQVVQQTVRQTVQQQIVDPNQRHIVDAVVYMRNEYWSQGKMHGQLLEQWHRIFAQLLNGAQTAQQVSNCAHLADYAFVVGLRRQNMKAPKS